MQRGYMVNFLMKCSLLECPIPPFVKEVAVGPEDFKKQIPPPKTECSLYERENAVNCVSSIFCFCHLFKTRSYSSPETLLSAVPPLPGRSCISRYSLLPKTNWTVPRRLTLCGVLPTDPSLKPLTHSSPATSMKYLYFVSLRFQNRKESRLPLPRPHSERNFQ